MNFARFRVCLGLYLAGVLVNLWPWLDGLYSPGGWMPHGLVPRQSLVGPWLLQFDSPLLLRVYCAIGILAALVFASGKFRKAAAVILFLPLWFFFHRNPFSVTEEYAYMLWLLLATLLVPAGEGKRDGSWRMPRELQLAAWVVLAAGYSYAGLIKVLQAESIWRDGTALYYLLAEATARRGWYGEWYSLLPMPVYQAATYLLLAVQLLALPLLANRKTRLVLWCGMGAFHLGALLFMDITSVTLGMLLVHLFVNPFSSENNPAPGRERAA